MFRSMFLATAILAVATPALAQSRAEWGGRARAMFASADRDRDGRLTRGEVTQRINASYPRRMSTGRSRILTNQWFNRLDDDRNNLITRPEALKAANELFGRVDRNRDGRLDPRERRAGEALLRNPAR